MSRATTAGEADPSREEPAGSGGVGLNIKDFLKSWNGILFILFIGIFLMFPAMKSLFAASRSGEAPEWDQIQTFVGALAVVWAARAIWGKFAGKNDE